MTNGRTHGDRHLLLRCTKVETAGGCLKVALECEAATFVDLRLNFGLVIL